MASRRDEYHKNTAQESKQFTQGQSTPPKSENHSAVNGEPSVSNHLEYGSQHTKAVPEPEVPELSKSNDEEGCSKGGSRSDSHIKEGPTDNDVYDLIEKLQRIPFPVHEVELSESQKKINEQEQEDEMLALQAIYGEDLFMGEKKDDMPHNLKISIHVELLKTLTIKVKLPSGRSQRGSDTLSSNEHIYTFCVQHLPPITLLCSLPKSYPSSVPPKFVIFSHWLDLRSISDLCSRLDKIWNEEPGEVVIFKWADWLHSSALPHLGFESELLVDPHSTENDRNQRAISGFYSPDIDIPRLMRYNEEKENQIFCSSIHECPICFTEFPGTDVIKLPCQHIFCWNCMKTYAIIHVKDGTVNKLKCPDTKCVGSIPPNLLKKLLGEEAFQRWESLLLQKTLDSMKDVVYCPRCESVCLSEEDHHAQCVQCFYSFCSLCNDRRHVGKACLTPDIRLQILQERLRSNQNQTPADRRKREQNLINEVLSIKQITSDCKKCPSCNMAISKIEGCNKVVCSNCDTPFCYVCGRQIDGYDHFSSENCQLYREEEIQNWERYVNDRQLRGMAQVELFLRLPHPCPNCRQLNYKLGNNNHIFCWACQTHFCALCRKIVRRSSEHYGPKGCKQHTAD